MRFAPPVRCVCFFFFIKRFITYNFFKISHQRTQGYDGYSHHINLKRGGLVRSSRDGGTFFQLGGGGGGTD